MVNNEIRAGEIHLFLHFFGKNDKIIDKTARIYYTEYSDPKILTMEAFYDQKRTQTAGKSRP